MIPALLAAIPALFVAAPAWADHEAGLRGPGMSPIATALLWASAAFLVGLAVIGIVTLLSRRRSSPPPNV